VIEHNGEILGESRTPYLLFEPPLPVRYYLPSEDVSLDMHYPSATTTFCAHLELPAAALAPMHAPSCRDLTCWPRATIPHQRRRPASAGGEDERARSNPLAGEPPAGLLCLEERGRRVAL
jgi:hypothetical protein